MANLENYFIKIDTIINKIIERENKEIITFDLLDTKKTIQLKLEILKEKQKQMKIGEIWQEVIGNYQDFINLKIGHKSGLDIISLNRKIIIELDGKQHFEQIGNWQSPEKTRENDIYKMKCANDNGFSMYIWSYISNCVIILFFKNSNILFI